MTRKIIDFAAVLSLLALLATSAHAQQTVNGQPVVPASQITGTLPVANGGLNTATAPTSAQIPVASGTTAYVPQTVSGDCTMASTGAITCAKTNGSGFTSLATAAVGQVPGTTTNDSAAAGDVGEIISTTVLSGSAVSIPASGNTVEVGNVLLTAGNWKVYGTICYTVGGATASTRYIGQINDATATLQTAPNAGALFDISSAFPVGAGECFPVGQKNVKLAAGARQFLDALAIFSGGTAAAYGYIAAERLR